MKARIAGFVGVLVSIVAFGASGGPSTDNPALNAPDQVAWSLFMQVNAPGGCVGRNDALFETWADDGDTFNMAPAWPVGCTGAKALRAPILPTLRLALLAKKAGHAKGP